MGMLVDDGQWQDVWYDTASTGGKFVRKGSSFRHRITAGEGGRAWCPTRSTQPETLYQVYQAADPAYTGRVTVPVLWDRKTAIIAATSNAISAGSPTILACRIS